METNEQIEIDKNNEQIHIDETNTIMTVIGSLIIKENS